MSNANLQNTNSVDTITLPIGPVPVVCTLKSARALYRRLWELASESALATGRVNAAEVYAAGLAIAILAAADNQSAPLDRVRSLAGAKPSKAVSARLQYWSNCASAGKAHWRKDAETVSLIDVIRNPHVNSMSAESLAAAVAHAKLAAQEAAQEAANAARVEAVEKAAHAAEAEAALAAAKAIREAQESANRAAYTDVARHGSMMDNSVVDAGWLAYQRAEQARAERAAWLAERAAERVQILAADRAMASAEFLQLAATLGVNLTPLQVAAARGEQIATAEPAKVQRAPAKAAKVAKAA